MKNHNLTESFEPCEVLVERRAACDRASHAVKGLHNVWITLNNPAELERLHDRHD